MTTNNNMTTDELCKRLLALDEAIVGNRPAPAGETLLRTAVRRLRELDARDDRDILKVGDTAQWHRPGIIMTGEVVRLDNGLLGWVNPDYSSPVHIDIVTGRFLKVS